ncbi:hypothetical protein [Terricaulis silvestris]|uniref:Uncharacterized protein n=1 Tax=Terricaulis silvestris TaxID=2686094 RepID=A0A6I6MHW6_9CAUL|nr:hypothetical protein [Terricaulis silvestris]QGZ94550.1 hypothetical protein DSM104635_01369 [Terricaulis silvestris]
MFDRAMASVISTAAASAAAVMAVFASGFAIYALILPTAGPAGAAAIVALIATLGVALFALFVTMRNRKRELEREREAAALQAEVMDELPLGLGDIARERPIVTLAVTALGGILAARHPSLARDLIGIVARFGRR